MTLPDDVVRVLDGWSAPDAEQEALRVRFLSLMNERPGAVSREHAGMHITASTLVVDADAQRVLLCLHGRVRRWLQVGGHLEPEDPTLAAAALREATEETGIHGLRLDPTPIHLDIHRVNCRSGPSDHYDVRFAAIAPPGAVEQVSDESEALGWFAPGALPSPMGHATEVLIAPALVAATRLRLERGENSLR
jgi:8-oxo-dGTP pyrophosphatase MutT (NUDIX family)